MSVIVGTQVNDVYIMRDDADVAITGLTAGSFATLTAFALPSGSPTATVTLTELGGGRYSAGFTPTTAGDWSLYAYYNAGGVVREFETTFDVLASNAVVVTPVATATNAGLTITLAELRRRVARRLGDYAFLTATSDGANNTIIDAFNVNAGAENWNGRYLYCTAATNSGNVGATARVTTTTDSTSTLTFVPAFGSITKSGDAFDAFNFRGIGFSPQQYKDAINDAINDAYPLGLIELQADIASFDGTAPGTITVPATMREVYAIDSVDGDGNRLRTLTAGATNGYGWSADAANGEVAITGWPAFEADGLALRIYGYGRQDTLSADTDTCALNAEYIVSRACYHLTLGKIGSDSSYGQMVNVFLNESTRLRTRLRVIRKPGARLVRSI